MLKLSTRVRYGLRAAVELALRGAWRGGSGRPVPLSAVVKCQKIPEPYLRQIFFSLKKAGLVEAAMGKSGGYRLTRNPVRVTANDVLKGLGETIVPVPCVRKRFVCSLVRACPTHPLWCRVADMLKKAMSLTTVGQLAERCPLRGRRPWPRETLFEI